MTDVSEPPEDADNHDTPADKLAEEMDLDVHHGVAFCPVCGEAIDSNSSGEHCRALADALAEKHDWRKRAESAFRQARTKNTGKEQ